MRMKKICDRLSARGLLMATVGLVALGCSSVGEAAEAGAAGDSGHADWKHWYKDNVRYARLPPQAGPKGRSWYLAPDGSDDAAGTIDAPWATLECAARHMAPGDVTYLRGGTYAISSAIRPSGTDGSPITFTAYPGETPTIIGPQNGRSDTLEYQGSYIVMDHLRFSSQARGIIVSMNLGTHDNVISNCEIFGSLQSGLIVSGSNNLIEGNNIHDNGTHAAMDHGIYLEGDHNVVRANVIHDNWTMGVQVYNGWGVTAGENTIEGNYLYHNGYGSPGVGQTGLNCEIYVGGENSPNNVVRNNVMCGNAHYAMYLWGNPPGTRIEGNVSCNNGSGGLYLDAPGAGTIVSGNVSYNDAGPTLLIGGASTSDKNTYYQGGGLPNFQWYGNVMDLAAYVSASGQDAQSHIADPAFTTPPPQGTFASAAAASYNFCSPLLPALCP